MLLDETRGEPDAVEVARPVREADRRNGAVEILTPRSGSTSPVHASRAFVVGGLDPLARLHRRSCQF